MEGTLDALHSEAYEISGHKLFKVSYQNTEWWWYPRLLEIFISVYDVVSLLPFHSLLNPVSVFHKS